jgi:hypothetical protein
MLSISDLFTPAETGVDPTNPAATPPAGSWLAQLLANGAALKLSTTAWQPGGQIRTMIAMLALALGKEDRIVSVIAKGGFLDSAAEVTDDPALLGIDAKAGWLDVLALSTYRVTRLAASYAPGRLYLANTSASTYGAFATGVFHVANPASKTTYSNRASLTIAPSTVIGGTVNEATFNTPIVVGTVNVHGLSSGAVVYISGVLGNTAANGFWRVTLVSDHRFSLDGSVGTGAWTSGGKVYGTTSGLVAADVAGAAGTAATRTLTQPVVSLLGVVCANLDPLLGTDAETNALLVARCRAKLGALSPNGPAQAYTYVALSASQILAALDPPVALTFGPITRVLVTADPGSGTVTTTIANALGSTDGAIGLVVTAATNATPIVLTVADTTGLATGDWVFVAGVEGNTAANGYHQIGTLTGTTIQLVDTIGSGAYVAGGIVAGGDLGLVDELIQSLVVPLAITAVTQWAATTNVTVALTAYAPSGSAAVADITAAIEAYFAAAPVGGFVNGVPAPNTLPIAGVEGACFERAPYLRDLTLTLNGASTDVAIGATSVPVLLWNGGSPATAITLVTF